MEIEVFIGRHDAIRSFGQIKLPHMTFFNFDYLVLDDAKAVVVLVFMGLFA